MKHGEMETTETVRAWSIKGGDSKELVGVLKGEERENIRRNCE